MPKDSNTQQGRIDQFFSGPGTRADHWRDLQDRAQAWTNGTGTRADFDRAFDEMAGLEEYHAYPGAHLLNALEDTAATEDARATAALVMRIANALITRSFRKNGSDWEAREDSDAVRDVLPPTLGRGDPQRPYFETLIVTGQPSDRWGPAAAEWRR
jgi:arginine decarboxylase